jgi:hypothetical protein
MTKASYASLRRLWSAGSMTVLFIAFSLAAGANAQSEVVFEETFSNGLGSFSGSGRVYTGSYGVRMRGSAYSDGTITSAPIDTSAHDNLVLNFSRTTSGLDWGEQAIAAVSINGGSFTELESVRSASGAVSFDLGSDADTVVLRFAIDASSFYETYEISSIVIEGDPTGSECPPEGCECPPEGCEPPPPPVMTDPGTGPWQLVSDVASECNLDPALLAAANREFNETYVIVRYGKLCHEHYPSGSDSPSSVWSATKTLGAATVGAAMYQSRNFVNTGRKTGPLTEFQRVDHWLDSFDYNRDATIAHVLSMEAHNTSLAYGDKSHSYDTVGSVQINTLSDIVNQVISQDPDRLGNNIGEFYEQYLANKLGFRNSTWGSSNYSKNFAYTLTSTARDMARLGLLLLNGGVWNGERLMDAEYVYSLGHAAFEDGSTRYGYLTWLSEDDPCGPAPIHHTYPHGISEASSCLRAQGCDQTYDVGVFYAAGLGGQYIIQHRGLDMVIVVKDSGGQSSNEVVRAWDAIRPAVVAMDPNYAGNETGFCRAYGNNDYAPDLKLWEGGL